MQFQSNTHRGIRLAVLALAALLTMFVLAATAQAKAKDANRDGIPDRWEKRNHLSLKVSQARRDQDHDGVVNICEHQASSNPRRKDSDRDGVRDGAEDSDRDGVDNVDESRSHSDCGDDDGDRDGVADDDENAGKIVSFENGVLTIETVTGETISGVVNELTKIECDGRDDDDASPPPAQVSVARDREDDAREGEGTRDDDECGDRERRDGGGDSAGDSGHDDDGHHGDDDHCTAADLLPGTIVHEATLVDGTFTEIELIK